MAAGKNAASTILEKKGFISIDADSVVHQILLTPSFQQRVLSLFSTEAAKKNILLQKSDGSLDRRALAVLLFKNKKLLAEHEALIHPEVERLIRIFITNNPDRNIAINATVLYKIPVISQCSPIIYIDAPLLIRFIRVKKRDIMTFYQIMLRFHEQRKLFAKYRAVNADIYRVRNTGNFLKLEQKIDQILTHCR